MKTKYIIMSLFFLFSIKTFAQINYNIKSGIGFPSWSYKSQYFNEEIPDFDGKYYKSKTKSTTSFYISGHAEYKMKNNIALQVGILFEGRGVKLPESDYKANFLFIGIPMNVLYYIPTGTLGSTFIMAGTYVGVNFGGKYTGSDGVGGLYTEKMTYGRHGDLRSFDSGINLGIGYKFNKGYIINGNYNLGLNNLGHYFEKIYSRGVSCGIGYQF